MYSEGKIDKDKTYVCFVPDLIDVFSGFKRSVKVARALDSRVLLLFLPWNKDSLKVIP